MCSTTQLASLIVAVTFAQFVLAIPSGPSCLVRDPTAHDKTDLILPSFWQGIGETAPSSIYGTLVNVDIQGPGQLATYDIANNCGFVFFGLGQGPVFSFSAADIANLQSFTSAGGVIVILCEFGGFDPNCANIMNPLITAVDPTCPVQYIASTINQVLCEVLPVTATTNGFVNTPNDFTSNFNIAYSSSFTYPSATDPECLFGSVDSVGACTVAAFKQFLFFTDINTFGGDAGGNLPCQNSAYVQMLGQNIGAYVAVGGAGGDPHLFFFDGQVDLELKFGDGKKYIFYGNEHFRVVIETSGPEYANFITSIGITMHANQFLATFDLDTPVFYYNGERIINSISTPLGDAIIFNPHQELELRGALAELSRYLKTGISIGNKIKIVGGLSSSPFFNIEITRFHQSDDFGLLLAASVARRTRQEFNLSDFETYDLF